MLLRAVALATAAALVAGVRVYNTGAQRVRGKVNVHLVLHSHDDVGWLKTVDQYFSGTNNSYADGNVRTTYDSVTAELMKDPNRKFISVEQAFFMRWWEEQTPTWQAMTKQLVANGQLEFINGGWCQHDEANPTYVDMIDQTTLGHRLLLRTFNVTPRATWQIDPFGHSGTQASLLSSPLAGFNYVGFARIDYQDAAVRFPDRTREVAWFPSPSLGTSSGTLAEYFRYYYYPSPGFNFAQGADDPVIDSPDLTTYNVPSRVEDFVATALAQANQTLCQPDGTCDVLWTQGTDFSDQNAANWYTSTDKLIHYVNLDGRVNAMYSTPSIYATAKAGYGSSAPLPTKINDDYMPIADGEPNGGSAFWSGYFTSRPGLKGYIRDSSSVFQAAKQLQAATGGVEDPDDPLSNPLYLLERAIAVNQHHDAVSGTSKQHVAYDYAWRLARGRLALDAAVSTYLQTLTGYSAQDFASCDLTNVTICPALELGVPSAVAVYNQAAQPRTAAPLLLPVGFPAGVASYAVYDSQAREVTAQLFPLSDSDKYVRSEYYNYSSAMPVQWLALQADLPAAGYAVYFIVPKAAAAEARSTVQSVVTRVQRPQAASLRKAGKKAGKTTGVTRIITMLSNGIISLSYDTTTGMLAGYTDASTGVSTPFTQDFMWYNASTGSNCPQGFSAEAGKAGAALADPSCWTDPNPQPSGAYIFRPNSTTAYRVADDGPVYTLVTGPVVNISRQEFQGWASQNIRLWAGSHHVEFEWTIGPIPTADGLGKEIITRYSTGWNTNGTWWTDSNLRDSMTRVRNSRKYWDFEVTEPIAGNYYPVNGFIYTRDTATGNVLNVAVDRSEGGSSILDGSVELMVHRRLLADDNRGVAEPLSEPGLDGKGLIVRGIHRVSIDTAATAGRQRRTAVEHQNFKPLLGIATIGSGVTPAQWVATYDANWTSLAAPLPEQLKLLTVQSWGGDQVLVRLAHSYETGEDAQLSQPASVGLAQLFKSFSVTSAVEMTLTGNQPLATAPQTTYTTQDFTVTLPIVPAAPAGSALTVTLGPMQVRTFLCTVQYGGN